MEGGGGDGDRRERDGGGGDGDGGSGGGEGGEGGEGGGGGGDGGDTASAYFDYSGSRGRVQWDPARDIMTVDGKGGKVRLSLQYRLCRRLSRYEKAESPLRKPIDIHTFTPNSVHFSLKFAEPRLSHTQNH